MASNVRRITRTLWNNRALAVEAVSALAAASLAIRLLPFRTVVNSADARPVERARPVSDPLSEIRRVRWAIEAAARRLPWRIVCFQKGLALHRLLRRRGIESVLHYGVAQDERGLTAHVWVTHRGDAIIGGDEAIGYTCLATYPAVAQR